MTTTPLALYTKETKKPHQPTQKTPVGVKSACPTKNHRLYDQIKQGSESGKTRRRIYFLFPQLLRLCLQLQLQDCLNGCGAALADEGDRAALTRPRSASFRRELIAPLNFTGKQAVRIPTPWESMRRASAPAAVPIQRITDQVSATHAAWPGRGPSSISKASGSTPRAPWRVRPGPQPAGLFPDPGTPMAPL